MVLLYVILDITSGSFGKGKKGGTAIASLDLNPSIEAKSVEVSRELIYDWGNCIEGLSSPLRSGYINVTRHGGQVDQDVDIVGSEELEACFMRVCRIDARDNNDIDIELAQVWNIPCTSCYICECVDVAGPHQTRRTVRDTSRVELGAIAGVEELGTLMYRERRTAVIWPGLGGVL